ncbi:MAG: hypothetical protein ABW185_14240 [Sedimenticola sp.]
MEMHTDRASNFESKLFQEVCKLLGIHKTRTTASRPMSDGFVERGNRTIETMLSAFVDENQRNWDEKLPLLNLAYNSSIQETTGVTPSMMMLGREMNLPIDLAMGKPADNMIMSETDYAYQLEQRLAKTHEFARANLDIASHRMKRQYDRNTNYRLYETGEAVWYHDPRRVVGRNPKLQRPWKGPMVITQRINDILYRIKASPRAKAKVVHHDRLKPYEGGNKPSWYNVN